MNYLQILLEILNFYQEIDENLLNEKYGLDKGIGRKLLSKLVIEYPDYVITSKTGTQFKVKRNKEAKNLGDLKINQNLRQIIFSLCLNPLIFLKYRIPYTNLQENDNMVQLVYSSLQDLKLGMKSQEEKKRCFIPSEIEDIILESGVQVLGKSKLSLYRGDRDFELLNRNKLLIEIQNPHPVYQVLSEELDSFSNDEDLIKSKLEIWCSSVFSGIENEIKLNLSLGELEVKMLEKDLGILGKVFNLYNRYNLSEREFDINFGWKLRVIIRISFEQPILHRWVKFYSLLNASMEKTYLNTLPNLGTSLKNIEEVWNTLTPSPPSKFQKNYFIKYLKLICNYNPELWFSHILARIMEEEIFV